MTDPKSLADAEATLALMIGDWLEDFSNLSKEERQARAAALMVLVRLGREQKGRLSMLEHETIKALKGRATDEEPDVRGCCLLVVRELAKARECMLPLVEEGFVQLLLQKRVNELIQLVIGEEFQLSATLAEIAQQPADGGAAETGGLQTLQWWLPQPINRSSIAPQVRPGSMTLDKAYAGLNASESANVVAPAVTLAAFQARSTSEPGAFAAPLALPASPPPAYATVEATSVPVTTEAHAGRDVPLSIASAETPGALATALRGLASLQDALLAEEVAARRAASPSDEDAGAFCDAVFRKAATLLRADALHPLVHVTGAWRGHEQRRRDAALAERDRLLAETSASA